MVVERGVLSLGVLEVPEAGLVSASVMVVENVAISKDAIKVLKEVLTFVKLMEEVDDVHGVNLAQALVSVSRAAISLPEVKLVSVLLTVPWYRTIVFMVVLCLGQLLLSHAQHPENWRQQSSRTATMIL